MTQPGSCPGPFLFSETGLVELAACHCCVSVPVFARVLSHGNGSMTPKVPVVPVDIMVIRSARFRSARFSWQVVDGADSL